MRARVVCFLCLAVLTAACTSKPDQREYTLQGQGLAVAPDRHQATTNHEEVKGLMAAVRRVGEAPSPQAPAEAPAASSGFELLKPGEAVPLGKFVDQDGRRRGFSSFKGSTVLITFIYTRCPMPTFCPLID